MKTQYKWMIFVLSLVPFIMVLGNSMLIPVLPAIQAAQHVSQVKVSLLITLFSLPAGIVIPLAGFLSDRFGRKKVIVPGLIIYGAGGLMAGLAAWLLPQAFGLMLGGRILQGIGAAGTSPIAMALVGDIFTSAERRKALGYMEATNGFGKVVSPILGAAIGMLSWILLFFVFPLLTIPIAIALWLVVKEPKAQSEPPRVKQYFKAIGKVFSNKPGLLFSCFLNGLIVLMLLFGVLFFLSDHLEKQYHMEGVIKGLYLAIPVLGLCITSFLTGILSQKKSAAFLKWLIVSGLTLLTVSLALLPLWDNIIFFFACILTAGIGSGLIMPCLNTIIVGTVNAEERGIITALYGSIRFFGVAIGPPLFGFLLKHGKVLTFEVPAAIALAGLLSALFLLKKKQLDSCSDSDSKAD